MVTYDKLAEYIIIKCNKDRKSISNLKLQKIVFYCQAYHISRYRERLIDNEFQAWKHGAVLAPLYQDYCSYGFNDIHKYDEEKYNSIIEEFGEYLTRFLDNIIGKFSGMSAEEIRDLNHQEAPWKKAREGYLPHQSCNEIISEESIYQYYSQILNEEGMSGMKSKKISIKSKDLILAKKRLAERELYKITEEEKGEYYESIYNNLQETMEYTWRAVNVDR